MTIAPSSQDQEFGSLGNGRQMALDQAQRVGDVGDTYDYSSGSTESHNKPLQVVAGLGAALVVIAGMKVVGPYFEGSGSSVVYTEQAPLTPQQQYEALQLQFVTKSGKIVTAAQASNTLSVVLQNELYAQEHGVEDGYRATFMQTASGDYGNFAGRVSFDRSVSSALVAGHIHNPKTYPTQSLEIENVTSVQPSSDNGVTIDATVKYNANIPNADGTPRQQTETVTAEYTLVRKEVDNFSDGTPRMEWLIAGMDKVLIQTAPLPASVPTN